MATGVPHGTITGGSGPGGPGDMALRKLEVGPAYAVWTGLGAAGTAVVGMWALGESVSPLKLVSIGLILAGVIGLNLSGINPL
jgi:quaternary ammonium compound-resistance protein SugE